MQRSAPVHVVALWPRDVVEDDALPPGDSIARGSARQVDDSHLVIDAVVHDDGGPPPCAIDHVALDEGGVGRQRDERAARRLVVDAPQDQRGEGALRGVAATPLRYQPKTGIAINSRLRMKPKSDPFVVSAKVSSAD